MPINYTNLSNLYNAKQLIPIIGNELLKIKKGSDRLLTFEEYFIEAYTGLNYSDDQCPQTISELALLKPELNSSDIIAIYESIPRERFDFTLLDKLVLLDKFDFFISTTYDQTLRELINEKRDVKAETIFWNHEKREPLYINFTNNASKIIHLFGGINNEFENEDISFADEDKLECLFNLSLFNANNPNRSLDKFSFLQYLRGKVLLFIGNNFQDLFMRLLIRTLYNSPYRNNKSKAYIVNDNKARLGFEKYFFEKYGIQIIHDSPIDDVINNLFNTIQGEQAFRQRYSHTLFISYDRTDVGCAETISKGLRNRGINAWLDTRDLGIATHREEIKRIIESIGTRIFVALLSKTLLAKQMAESYVKSLEWKIAENRRRANEFLKGRGDKIEEFVIIPIAVDDYNEYLDELPDFIEKENILCCTDPALLQKIEDKLKSLE
jgi:hypothetical protein